MSQTTKMREILKRQYEKDEPTQETEEVQMPAKMGSSAKALTKALNYLKAAKESQRGDELDHCRC